MKYDEICNLLSSQEELVVGPSDVFESHDNFKRFTNMYYAKSPDGSDKYHVKDIQSQLEINNTEKSRFYRFGKIQLDLECPKCKEKNVWVKFVSRSGIGEQPVCNSCDHNLESWRCDCDFCKLERKFQLLDEAKGYEEPIRKISKELIDEWTFEKPYELATYFDLLGKLQNHYKLKKECKINLSEMSDIASYGLCSSKLYQREDLALAICNDLSQSISSTIRSSLQEYVLWKDSEVNDDEVNKLITSLVDDYEANNFESSELEEFVYNEPKVIKKFIIAFGNQMGVDLEDIKPITIENVSKCLNLMPLSKILYAIKYAIRNGYSYGQENRLGSKIVRNYCVSNLNNLYKRYTEDGWDIPKYEIPDWQLQEHYDISSESETNEFFDLLESDLSKEDKVKAITDQLHAH